MTTKEYQDNLYISLRSKLSELEIKNEWIAFPESTKHYSPRVDIAIGPFSIYQQNIDEYDRLINQGNIRSFLRSLYDCHKDNIAIECQNENHIEIPNFEELLIKNRNARCLLAFEIENRNSRKHIMGSLINAASLGRIGIGIAYSENTLKTFIRILKYLQFLKQVEKNTYDTTNFLIITKEQMVAILNN